MAQSPLIAVDTNVPLDLAERKEDVRDAMEIIRRRLKPGRVLWTPTVLQEIVFLSIQADTMRERRLASEALRSLSKWQMEAVNLIAVGQGVVERVADRLTESGLLPSEEYNDALILAEAAFLGSAILLTSDAHLRGLDFQRTALQLKAFDVEMPVIATPREIVWKFL
jgi:predicted nucleic acid-binding protein